MAIDNPKKTNGLDHSDEQSQYSSGNVQTSIPPFPDDVATVPLLRISLQRLLCNDINELERLWRACRDVGFFYLDLRNADSTSTEKSPPGDDTTDGTIDGNKLLNNADDLFTLGAQFFQLPVTEKQKYDFKAQGSYFGYKGFGAGVIDAKGTKDRNEFYNTSKDYVLGLREALPEPALLTEERNRAVLRGFILRSHAVVTLLLDALEDKLGLEAGTLRALHRLRAVSGDQVRWVQSPPQPEDDRRNALGEHTDFGSITFLFNRLGGLQVRPPGQEEWAYVKPLPGHCIVNLGDALVKFSANILRSNIHRVVNPPGAQAEFTRMSLVYFARPEDDVMLKALEGSKIIDKARRDAGLEEEEEEQISANDWILRRALGRRAGGDWKQSQGTENQRVKV